MNNVRQQELGNELQSSQHLRLQSASRKLLDIATVPAGSGKVQRKKPIAIIGTDDFLRVIRAVIPSNLWLARRASQDCRDLGFCRRNAASGGRTNPGPSLVLTAQARLGAALGMTVPWRSCKPSPGMREWRGLGFCRRNVASGCRTNPGLSCPHRASAARSGARNDSAMEKLQTIARDDSQRGTANQGSGPDPGARSWWIDLVAGH
jgi:hypothetical protein